MQIKNGIGIKKFTLLTLIFAVSFSLTGQQIKAQQPISVILDTDIGNDIDDVLALQMLFNYQKLGMVNLLGITLSKSNPYAFEYVDGICRFNNRTDIPLGYVYNGPNPENGRYTKAVLDTLIEGGKILYPKLSMKDQPLEGFKLQRKLLGGQPDNSVVMIVIGPETNISRLLKSGPDEFSKFSGVELVKKKVRLLSVMTGAFSKELVNKPEWNIVQDINAAQTLFDKWPSDIVASGSEVGNKAYYPAKSILNDFPVGYKNPLCVSYMIGPTKWEIMPYDRPTWDLTSILYAIEPNKGYFSLSDKGIIKVDKDGKSIYKPKSNGKHRFLILSDENAKKVKQILIERVTGREGSSKSKIEVSDQQIFMQNDFLERAFVIKDGFYTRSFVTRVGGKEYSSPISREFSVSIDGKTYDGKSFRYKKSRVSDIANGKELIVELIGQDDLTKHLEINLLYWIYDNSPTVRKQIKIRNNSEKEVILTNLDVENLYLVPSNIYMTNIYSNYGTNITRIPYVGDYYDPAILAYSEIFQEGFILGNEAPGILKRTDCYSKDNMIAIGMKRENDDYPFKKYLAQGELFESPKSFILFTKQKKWQDCFEVDLGEFLRNDLGVKLFKRDKYPLFYYCSWIPFQSNINEKLLKEVADSLVGTGAEVMIIDDGWQEIWGDYNSDTLKFPKGIEETCQYIKSKGIIPGMWFDIATIRRSSKIFHEHPEWTLKTKKGNPANVYGIDSTWAVTMSMSSPWYDYTFNKLKYYIKTCQLGYVKLDFAVLASAYISNKEISGDYGTVTGKFGYRDQASSYWSLYNALTSLFNDLSKEFPDLIIDCTFETWGKYHLVDYALIQNADVDWLTNYEFDPPKGPISIRQVTNERQRVVPVQTMMIGNQQLNNNKFIGNSFYQGGQLGSQKTMEVDAKVTDKMNKYTFFSMASGVLLECGDPRDLTPVQKQWYKNWSDWFRLMDKKYQYTRFRYMSDIFEKPSMTNWDGCYRFNSDKQGGVLFFYRNGSLNNQMIFPVDVVEPNSRYHIYEPCGGKDWGVFYGGDIIHNGLTISIANQYEAKVLGVEKIITK